MPNATRLRCPALPRSHWPKVGERVRVHWRDHRAVELSGVVRQTSRAGFHLELTGTVPQTVCGRPADVTARGELVAVLWSTVKRVTVAPGARRSGAA